MANWKVYVNDRETGTIKMFCCSIKNLKKKFDSILYRANVIQFKRNDIGMQSENATKISN